MAERGKKRGAEKVPLWVVKAGSEMVVGGGPLLIRDWMRQVADLRRAHGIRVIWVTSGAIASARLQMRRSWSKLPEKQALSAIGQPLIMDAYNLALRTCGLVAAQVLLTNDDMADVKRARNLKNSLSTLLKWDAVPILNENDAVATEEIQFGDNDSLSARVAEMMKANQLVILTDVAGLHDRAPKVLRGARLIAEVPADDAKGRAERSRLLRGLDVGGKSRHGSGGMASKVQAALRAQAAGVTTWLVKGDEPDGLLALANGGCAGTVFRAKSKRERGRRT